MTCVNTLILEIEWLVRERGDQLGLRGVRLGMPSFCKWMKWSLIVCLSFTIGVVAYAAESDDYIIFLKSITDSTGAFMGSFFNGKDSGSKSANSTGKSAVNAADIGKLNLNLIDRIPDVDSGKKGYIRELLNIYRDSENGKINSGVHLPVSVLLGMHTNEVGSAGSTPYYFKPEQWKKGKANYCLMDYTSTSFNTIGNPGGVSETGGIGIFQNTSGASGAKSKVNPLSVKRGTSSGDVRFLPDMITTSANKSSIGNVNSKLLDSTAKSMFGGLSNNRGAGGAISCMLGVYTGYGYADTQHCSNSKLGTTATKVTVKYITDLYINYSREHLNYNAATIAGFDNDKARFASCIIALHDSDWYFNSYMLKDINAKIDDVKSVWKALYPKEKKSNAEIKKIFREHTKTLPEAIKATTGVTVSASECKRVYGTNGNYGGEGGYSWFESNGGAFHVTKTRDKEKAYTRQYSSKCGGSKKPFIVSGMDGISFGYLFSVSPVHGSAVYGKLLKEAGVNSVDPTDPSTFVFTAKTVNTITPTWSGELSSVYNGYKIDRTKLTPDRIAVLNAAAEMAYKAPFFYGSTDGGTVGHFSWCTIGSDTGFGTDCAHYCGLAYYYAGFNVTYESTSGLLSSRYCKSTSFSSIKPGDILCKVGGGTHHAVIYLSGKSLSSVSVIEAKGRTGRSFDEQVSITSNRNCSGYTVLRNKDIDKGKRGKARSIPHSKPKTEAKRLHPYGTYGP